MDEKTLWDNLKEFVQGKMEYHKDHVTDFGEGIYSAYAKVLDVMHNLEKDKEKG